MAISRILVVLMSTSLGAHAWAPHGVWNGGLVLGGGRAAVFGHHRRSTPPLPRATGGDDADTATTDAWSAVLPTALSKLSELVDETVVIKYGGHAMGAPEARASFARDVALLQVRGRRKQTN